MQNIWAVSRSGLVPPRKHDIKKETAKTYVLDDGTVVKKNEMQNTYQLFFNSEASAETTYQMLKSVFDPEKTTNLVAIKGANVDKMSDILFGMIQDLCEDGMPTKETIKNWLLAEAGSAYKEDYSNLSEGDKIFYVDVKNNEVKQGTISNVHRREENDSITFISIEFADDFMGINGVFLGKELFIDESMAHKVLERSKNAIN